MKYDIEHTNQKLLKTALFMAIGIFLLIETLMIWLVLDKALLGIGIIAGFVVAIVYFFIKKRKVKLYGNIIISPNHFVFNVFGLEKTIHIQDIQQYRIIHFKGASLTLKLKNREKFEIAANENFCNAKKLEKACLAIEETIEEFSANAPLSQETPVKEKTVFEKSWFIALLSVGTIGAIIAIIYALANGKKLHQLLAPLVIFIGLWAGVLKSRSKRKN